jgi:hypothetical protein
VRAYVIDLTHTNGKNFRDLHIHSAAQRKCETTAAVTLVVETCYKRYLEPRILRNESRDLFSCQVRVRLVQDQLVL